MVLGAVQELTCEEVCGLQKSWS